MDRSYDRIQGAGGDDHEDEKEGGRQPPPPLLDQERSTPPAKEQIMTVLGPLPVDDDDDDSSLDFGPVLMHEHLLSSRTKPITIARKGTAPDVRDLPLRMEHLSTIRYDPYRNVDNMSLTSETNIVNEVRQLVDALTERQREKGDNQRRRLAILDVTTSEDGRDPAGCQRIAKKLGIHILIGSTCLPDEKDDDDDDGTAGTATDIDRLQRNIEHLERELKYGIGTKADDDYDNLRNPSSVIRASFCGPLRIPADFKTTGHDREQQHLRAYASVQNKSTTRVPLILVPSSLYDVPRILDVLERSGGLLPKVVIANIDLLYHQAMTTFTNEQQTQHTQQSPSNSTMDSHNNNDDDDDNNNNNNHHPMLFLQTKILQRGVTVCFDQYSVSCCADYDFDHRLPTLSTVIAMISALVETDPSYVRQVVVSCGIRMKLQYTKYGGVGYTVATEQLVPRLIEQGGLSPEQVETILHDNPRRLLQWWVPPPLPTKPKRYLDCSLCHQSFEPVLGEYYTKYSYTYCGAQCLRKHRLMKFKPLD
jgi:predicted metal-dependent phosphotriesterase family hydrolase